MFESEERRGLVFTLIGGGVLALALLIGLGFFSSPAPDTPDSTSGAVAARAATPALRLATVRGRGVDARSGFGLAALRIEVRGLDGVSDHWLAPAEEAAPGAFELRGLPAGRRCTVALLADGYVEATREVEAHAGAIGELGDVALTPLAALFGRVVDAMETGLAPARVELCSLDGKVQTGEVDAHGGFRFERLAPADYLLRARTEAGDTPLAPLAIDAKRGGEQRGLVLALFPTVSLRGTFQLPAGSAPLAGVIAQGRRGTVRGDGTFVVDGIRAGPTRLVALRDEQNGVAFHVGAPFEGVELAVDPATATSLADERPDPAATAADATSRDPLLATTLIVRVVDADGARIGGARVQRLAAGDVVSEWTYANRSGECVLHVFGADGSIQAEFGDLAGATTLPKLDAGTTREVVVTVAPPVADR